MGSTAITYAGVALVVALVCLLLGFFWGRSNVRSKVEHALEQEHVALDAREFGMRQQLDDAFAEVARLRPLAEDLARVQERLRSEQKKYEQMRAEFNSMLGIEAPRQSAAQESAVQPDEPAPVAESADEAIQRLLQSLETFNAPSEQPEPSDDEPQGTDNQPQPAYEQRPLEPSVDELHGVEEQPERASEELRVRDERPRPAYEAPQKAPKLPKPLQEPVAARMETVPVNPRFDPPAPRKVAIDEGRKRSPGVQQGSQSRPETVDEWQEFARSLADLTRRNQ